MSIQLGIKLRKLRENCELRQKQVATALNIDRSTYSYYETGHTEPDLKTIVKLAKIYGVTPEFLLPETDRFTSVDIGDPGINTQRLTVPDFDTPPADPVNPDELEKKIEQELSGVQIYSLSRNEKELLVGYRALSEDSRQVLDEFLLGLLSDENGKRKS